MQLGIVALRHQLTVYQRCEAGPRIWHECLDHVIVLNEEHLRRVLRSYFDHYIDWRTHLSLDMDCPEPRMVQTAQAGEIAEVPEVGDLHHHYERTAA